MSLNFRVVWGALDLTAYPYSIMWGTDLGAPESVTQVMATLLQDGDYEITDRAGNRELVLPILTEGDNLDDLAAAEEALVLEARKPLNTLSIDPGDGAGAVTVFDTFAGVVELARNDDYEEAGYRVWNATITALPFGRDETLTTVTAATPPPVAQVLTSIDNGASASNWTAINGSAPSSSGSLVSTTAAGTPTSAQTRLKITSNINRSVSRYVVVDFSTTGTPPSSVNATLGTNFTSQLLHGELSAPVSTGVALAPGFTRAWFNILGVGGSQLQSLDFILSGMFPGEVLAIDQVFLIDNFGSLVDTWNNGSSTTGWTATNGSAVSTSSGAVQTTALGGTPAWGEVGLKRSSLTVDVSSNRYLMVDWTMTGTMSDEYKGTESVIVTSGGVDYTASLATVATAPGTGYRRSYFSVPTAAPTTLTAIALRLPSMNPSAVLRIDQLSRANVVPGLGTQRQLSRSITVGGTARTRASLSVAATTTGHTLGDVTMIYTRNGPASLAPPLRPWRTSSDAVTADTTTASGSRNALGGTMTFLIPANNFAQAAHNLTALLRATSTGDRTITWTTQLMSAAGATVPESVVTASGSVVLSFPVANTWYMHDLGTLALPNVPVASDSTLVVRLTLIASSSVVQIDDAYLFDLDNGALSWVSSTSLTRLEARTADLTLPRPSYWGGQTNLGTSAAMSRADFRVVSYGTHIFEPGPLTIFTLTLGTEESTLSLSYYRAWHTSARAA